MNMQSRRTTRRAFTLVELLVVITIIGVLASLTSVAVYRALRSAQQGAITFELNQLTAAMQQFKEQKTIYPMNFGTASLSSTYNRAVNFPSHWRAVFPRVSTYAYATMANTSNFGAYTNSYGVRLAIDNLDPAESLVFWLAGMPTPGASGVYGSKKIYGFHQDPANPIRLEAATATTSMRLGFRTPAMFEFNEGRLLDQDKDGWWEYVPNVSPNVAGLVAPYVYFDGPTYNIMTTRNTIAPFLPFPNNTAIAPTMATTTGNPYTWASYQSIFGLSYPYARAPFPTISTSALSWMNPNSFQLVSGGLDSMYSTPGNPATPRLPAAPTIEYPTSQVGIGNVGTAASQYGTIIGMDAEESDNLANFTTRDVSSEP